MSLPYTIATKSRMLSLQCECWPSCRRGARTLETDSTTARALSAGLAEACQILIACLTEGKGQCTLCSARSRQCCPAL